MKERPVASIDAVTASGLNIACSLYPGAYDTLFSLDEHSQTHSFRVAAIALGIADCGINEELKNSDHRRLILLGALFHDLGKSQTPADLSLEEYRRQHMEANLRLCCQFEFSPQLTRIIMSHHDAYRLPVGTNYLCGPNYPRVNDQPHEERRQQFPPNIERIALIVWFADKLDRLVNGYENSAKPWEEFLVGLNANFPPEFHRDHPDLVYAAKKAIYDLFYQD